MIVALYLFTVVIAVVAGVRSPDTSRSGKGLVAVTGLVLATAEFAGALAPHIKVRGLVAFICVLFLITYVGSAGRRSRSGGRDLITVVAFVLIFAPFVGYEVLAHLAALDGGQRDRVWRFGVEFPLCAVIGYLLVRERLARALQRQLLMTALWLAFLALVEQFRGQPFVNAPVVAGLDFRYGSLRARVGAEHPLVLSTIVLIAVPIAVQTLRSSRRAVAVLLLAGGIQATASRGALIILIGYLVYLVLAHTLLRHPMVRRTAFLAVAAAAAALLFSGSLVDSVSSVNADTASTQYRGALYSLIATTIRSHPFGWGFSGLPQGVYLLNTSFGVLDVANTVDSEVVLAAIDGGLLGLALYAFVLVLPLLAPTKSVLPRCLAMVTLSGLYLALHAWTGLGAIWWLLIGAVLAEWRTARTTARHDESAAERTGDLQVIGQR